MNRPNYWTDLAFTTLRFILCELPIELLGLLVVPVALLFCTEKSEHLPMWARWFDELDYGINGDPPWQGPEHADGHQREYAWRWKWLMRNRTNGWSKLVTGVKTSDISALYFLGDRATSNSPGHAGYLRVRVITNEGVEYREHYLINHWTNKLCLRVRIGHKFLDLVPESVGVCADEIEVPLDTSRGRDYCQFVFVTNPVMSFKQL